VSHFGDIAGDVKGILHFARGHINPDFQFASLHPDLAKILAMPEGDVIFGCLFSQGFVRIELEDARSQALK